VTEGAKLYTDAKIYPFMNIVNLERLYSSPTLIAEIGGNHEGNFEYARYLVDLAVNTPVDYVKFQIYFGDSLVSSFEAPDRNQHFKRFELSRDQHECLIQLVKQAGKKYLCSVWDLESIEWIEPHVDQFKVGSGDLTAYPILFQIAKTSKPILLSTGLSKLEEIRDAVHYLRSTNPIYKQKDYLTLLQCTSMYPIGEEDAHLRVMQNFKSEFQTRVGYSDHTVGTRALQLAAVLGADVLEFHFTDTRLQKTFRDHAVSLTPDEVHQLVKDIERDMLFMGDATKVPLPVEIEAGHVQSFRRAVYPSRDIESGEILGLHNLTFLRPNKGIDARSFDMLIGKTAAEFLPKHKALNWESIR